MLSAKNWREVIFYFHWGLIFGLIGLGFFLEPIWMTIIIIGHQLHLSLFNGCLLTHYEKRLGGIPPTQEFFQYSFRRFFNWRMTRVQSRWASFLIAGLALGVSIFTHTP